MTDTATSSTDFDTVMYCRDLFRNMRSEKAKNYSRWQRNYKLVRNQIGVKSPEYLPSYKDSEIYPHCSSLIAWMTDQNTTVEVTPASDPHSDFNNAWSQKATDLEDVLQTGWHVNDFTRVEQLVIWDAFRYDMGVFKVVWNQEKAGGLGDFDLLRVDPWAFYVDPNANDFHDAEYFCEVQMLSLAEIDRRWPGQGVIVEAGEVLEGRDSAPKYSEGGGRPFSNSGPIAPATAPNYGRARQSFQDFNSTELTPVYLFWVKMNGEDYEELTDETPPDAADQLVSVRWKNVVIAGNHILMEEWVDELWDYGSPPYVRFVTEDMGELYGVSIVDHLADPQAAINKLLTSLHSNADLVGNPVWFESTNSGLARTNIPNRPGQRLRINANSMAAGGKPGWIEPPQMPALIKDLVEFWIARMENITGLSAMVKGQSPASRNAEGVMTTIQEAAFVRVRAMLRNLESALEECAKMMASLVVENYDEPRWVAIVGPGGEATSKALAANHFHTDMGEKKGMVPLEYTLTLNAGASMPTSRQARVAEADKLYAMGGVDRESLLEAHNYPNRAKVLDRIKQGMQDGTFSPPGARQRSQRKQ